MSRFVHYRFSHRVINGITIGVTALVVLIIAGSLAGSIADRTSLGRDGIGFVELSGIIMSPRDVNRQLRNLAKRVDVIVLRINSPGGGVAASQEIYEQVKRIRAEDGVRVVASMGSVAASGGYYVAIAADTIMASPGTLTGSIGVIAEYTEIDSLLRMIGVRVNVIKAGKYKDTGSPFRRMKRSERKYLETVIASAYDQFLVAVASGRKGIPLDSVRTLAEGRIYTGEMAKSVGLVDTLGTLQDALAFAREIGGLDEDAPIIRAPESKENRVRKLLGKVTGLIDRPSISLSYRMP
jgi:protease IV